MTCKFCITDPFNSMTMQQACHLLELLKSHGVDTVVLGGGEPFTWKEDVIKLSQIAKKMGFLVQVGTNGIRLPENFESIKSIDRYILPLDSALEPLHNYLRHYKKSHFSIILDRLETLKKAGKEVTLSTVINQKNISSLIHLAEFLQNYHQGGGFIHAWHLYRFIPHGREGKANAQELWVSQEEYNQACHQIKSVNPGFTIYKRQDMYHSQSVDFFWYQSDKICIGSQSTTHPDKKVWNPSHLLAYPVLETDLMQIPPPRSF